MNSSTSSGMLRNTSTYTPPSRASHFDGAIRNAATKVPTTMAIANAIATSRTVTQKPEENSDQCSVRTSTTGLVLLDQLHGVGHRDVGDLALLARVLADPLLVELRPRAVVLESLEDAVDEVDHLRVALLDARAVGLLRELIAHELQGLVLDDHPGQDHVVGGHGIDRAVLHELQALAVGVHELELGLRRLLLEVGLIGRAERRADVLAREILHARDRGVARHEHAPARDEVRIRELDLLHPLLVDRHRREDQVRRPVLQERDPVVGDRLDELRLDAELRRDGLAHLDVEALDLAALRILDP